MKYYVEIRQLETDQVYKSYGPLPEYQAEKVYDMMVEKYKDENYLVVIVDVREGVNT